MNRSSPLCLVLTLVVAIPLLAQTEVAADRAYDLAAGLHDRGLHERAVRAFGDFLERWPDDRRLAQARFHLADSLLAIDRPGDALIQLDLFLAAPVTGLKRQAAYARGDALMALKRPAEAARSFGAAVADVDDELALAATHFAAEALAAAGDEAAAQRMHQRLRKTGGSIWRLHSLSALAFMAARKGEHEAAVSDFDLVAAEAEGELALEARLMAAASRLELGRHQIALTALQTLAPLLGGARLARCAILEGRALVALDRVPEAGRRFMSARGQGLDNDLDGALIRAAADLHEAGRSAAGLELLTLVPVGSSRAGDAHYWRGVLAGASGRADEAIVSLRGALESRDDPRRRYRLADALMRAGRLEEAVIEFEAVVASKEAETELRNESRYALGYCRDALGERAAAAAIFAMLDHDEVAGDLRVEAVFARAECLFDLKKHREALPLYARVMASERAGLHRPARYKLAFCLARTDRRAEALKQFSELAAARPGDGLSHDCALMKARLLAELGRESEAAAAYGAAAKIAGSDEDAATAGLARAALLRRQGEIRGALAAYRALLAAPDESGGLALFGLAACQAELGDQAAARDSWEKFLDRHADHRLADEARLGLAWARRDLGLETEALQVIGQSFGESAFEAERLFLAGELLRSLGRGEEALRCLRASADKEPHGPRAAPSLLAAGMLARSRAELAEAAEDLDRLIARGGEVPEFAPALYERALVALDGEEPEQARGFFLQLEKDAALSPQGRDATFRLAEEDYAAGRHGEALARYESLLGREDLDDELRSPCAYKRAFALDKVDRSRESLEAFAAIGRAGGEFELDASFAAGDLALRLGRRDEALEHFERAWKLDPAAELGRAGGRRAMAVLGLLGRHAEVVERAGGRLDLEARDAWSLAAMIAYADARLALGEPRAARGVYAVVADHGAPDDAARARYQMGRSLAQEGREDAAVEAFIAVTVFHDEGAWSARALLGAAAILNEGGEDKKARVLLVDLLRDHPDEEVAGDARLLLKRIDAKNEEK